MRLVEDTVSKAQLHKNGLMSQLEEILSNVSRGGHMEGHPDVLRLRREISIQEVCGQWRSWRACTAVGPDVAVTLLQLLMRDRFFTR